MGGLTGQRDAEMIDPEEERKDGVMNGDTSGNSGTTPRTNGDDKPLTISDLYKGAGDEIAARIQARNRTILAFFSIASTIIGISLAEEGLEFTSLGVNALAVGTAILHSYHEMMIGILRTHQIKLLDPQADGVYEKSLYSTFSEDLRRVRLLRDFAQIVMYFLLSFAALLIASTTDGESVLGVHKCTWLSVSLAFALLAIVVLLIARSYRERKLGTVMVPPKSQWSTRRFVISWCVVAIFVPIVPAIVTYVLFC